MNKNDVANFEKLESQIQSLYEEILTLSKKKQDEPINKFKLGFINPLINEVNKLLQEKYKPFSNFEKFDEDSLPTNSDVVMILSQYLSGLESFRTDNIEVKTYGKWYWKTDDNSSIKTVAPIKLRRK